MKSLSVKKSQLYYRIRFTFHVFFGPPEGSLILFLFSPEVSRTSGTMSIYIYIYIYIYVNNMAHAKSVRNLSAIFR